jgi:hypothetical protein
MAWPLSQDYNEAVQLPASNFADPDLRRGEAVANALGLPMPYSGNFADVYQVRCPDGPRWAVKCFTREVPGLRERYTEISHHLRRSRLPFTVDFSYLEQGIRVGGRWYPVLKMQWVEGLTLNQFVAQHLDRPAMLEALLQIWVRLAQYLRAAEIGHGDLQHGNVLLVPGASGNTLALKLIDYDGMFVPTLAASKSGEVGHASYQHPQRLREGTYSLEVDRFPLLLVATALHALQARGQELWEKYDNGDNLLFKEADLLAPTKSRLFLDLFQSGDPAMTLLADQLLAALRGGLTSVPLLHAVLSGAPPVPAPAPAPRPVPTPPPPPALAIATAVAVAVADPVKDFPLPFAALTTEGAALVSRRKKRGGARIAPWVAGAVALCAVVAACALAAWVVQGEEPIRPEQRQQAEDREQKAAGRLKAVQKLVEAGR